VDLNSKSIGGGKEKEPLKCWWFREPHSLRDYPHNPKSIQNIEIVHEATIVNVIARNIPRISVALEDREAEH